MPITAAELVKYLPLNRPESDTATAGGDRDASARPLDSQLTATGVIAVVSDGADTRTVTIEGRDAAGNVVTEVLTLNGTTEVVGTQSFERILNLALSATDASRTVTVRQGSGGTTRHTFNPTEQYAAMMFQRSASEALGTTRYELEYWENTDSEGLALQNATVELTADPAAKIAIGVHTAVGNSGTITNRETAPAGVSFVDDGVQQNVPGGSLAANAYVGVWVRQTLAADDSAQRTTFTTQIAGQTA